MIPPGLPADYRRGANSRPARAGFTLVEMLVASAVFALMIVMVVQLTNNATLTTLSSRKRLDADSQARILFDRMANDLNKIVRRTDVDSIFYKRPAGAAGANDALYFYSEAPGYSSVSSNKSSVSLVGYRVAPAALQLERLGQVLTWDAATSNDATALTTDSAPGGMVFLAYQGATPAWSSTLAGNWSATVGTAANDFADGNNSSFHCLCEQVYRLEIQFLLSDGTLSTKPVLAPAAYKNNLVATGLPTSGSDSTAGYSVGSRWFDTTASKGYLCTKSTPGAAVWEQIGLRDLSAVIVAVAMLDPVSRTQGAGTALLVGALPDAVDGVQISKTWADSSYLSSSGIPAGVAGRIRIYQRCFFLNNN